MKNLKNSFHKKEKKTWEEVYCETGKEPTFKYYRHKQFKKSYAEFLFAQWFPGESSLVQNILYEYNTGFFFEEVYFQSINFDKYIKEKLKEIKQNSNIPQKPEPLQPEWRSDNGYGTITPNRKAKHKWWNR